MTPTPASAVTLRALAGRPLQDDRIREMVLATARAVAERQGIQVLDIAADDASVTIKLAADRIVALGLAAELRRLTTKWYAGKFGEPALWGEVEPEGGESWKRA